MSTPTDFAALVGLGILCAITFMLTLLFGVGALVWAPAFAIPFVFILAAFLLSAYRLWSVWDK